MKRVDSERRQYLIRVERKRARRKHKQQHGGSQGRGTPARAKEKRTVKAPEEFGIFFKPLRKRVCEFISELREAIGKGKRPVVIDFTGTQRMAAEGTLLFKAELCRLIRSYPGTPVSCLAPRDDKVSEVLKQVGIYELLGFDSKIKPSHDDVVNWRHAHGHGAQGKKYDEILGHYDGIIPNRLAEGLYVGITEAMSNCHHHAYIWKRKDGLNADPKSKDWWMFSQERDGKLTVVFCDLGVGIPETLPVKRPALWKRLIALQKRPKDGKAIEAALKESRSRTEKHYRGKGLKQLVNAIEQFPAARLLIMSNKRCYDYIANGNTRVVNYRDSILGTLIQWTVPISDLPAPPQ
ncbi:hypothetical protein [Thiohalomonas denitrificans]|uniref:hypothetical protein n=1 Tax=Thiohalomonas denitrificans TaxID=415747 RepID=UPI0026EF0784|nr:hypothetical protein [Thiohalomonas denitrificans]